MNKIYLEPYEYSMKELKQLEKNYGEQIAKWKLNIVIVNKWLKDVKFAIKKRSRKCLK